MLITARGCWERGDLLAQHRPCYGSSSGPKLKSDPGHRHSTCGQLAAIWRRVFYRGGPWRVCSSGSQLLAGAQLLPRQLQQALESCKALCEPLPDSPSPPPPHFPRGICRMPPKLFGLPQDQRRVGAGCSHHTLQLSAAGAIGKDPAGSNTGHLERFPVRLAHVCFPSECPF